MPSLTRARFRASIVLLALATFFGVTALQAAEQRASAMREYAQLIDKAYALGERGVSDRIRARSLAHEAEIRLRQQQAALGRAHAEHNQAAGVLP